MTDETPHELVTNRQYQAWHVLFALHGRIRRLPFIAGFPIVVGGALSLVYVSVRFAGNDQGAAGGAMSAVAFLLALAALWPLTALLAKRLHDLNRSGWHGVWIVALWLSLNLLENAFSTLATLAAVAVLIGVAALPGTSGPNAYGDPDKP